MIENNKELIERFKCELCNGFIIDATTITECFHSFCKTCIVSHLRTASVYTCPSCELSIKDGILSMHSDPQYQRLIYKSIPGLLKNEIQRRIKFYDENKNEDLLSEKSVINVKLIYENNIYRSSSMKKSLRSNNTTTINNSIRYLQCNANTPLRIFNKLLKNKYNMSNKHMIKFKYMDQELNLNETLIEIIVSFMLNKNDLVELKYEIVKAINNNDNLSSYNNNNNNDIKESPVNKTVINNNKEKTVSSPIINGIINKISLKNVQTKDNNQQSLSTPSSSSSSIKTLSTGLKINTNFLKVKQKRIQQEKQLENLNNSLTSNIQLPRILSSSSVTKDLTKNKILNEKPKLCLVKPSIKTNNNETNVLKRSISSVSLVSESLQANKRPCLTVEPITEQRHDGPLDLSVKK